MRRWLVFGAAWGFVSSGCALDMSGLAAPGAVSDDGGATSSTLDASGDDSIEAPFPAQDATASSSSDATASSEAGPASDAPAGDVSAPDADEGGMSTDCDQDGDGHEATGVLCGGDDCCDTDAHVHPGETAFYSTPGNCGGFDYNCDGKETPQYGAAGCSWNTFSCDGDGFDAPIPSCGDVGTFTSCSVPWYNVFSCNGSNQSQAQACR
jgi:hypothetical protein